MFFFSHFFFGGKRLRKWGVVQLLWETTTEQHQRGKLVFGICCPSSQNKTRALEVRGEEDKINLPPFYSSGGVPGLGRRWGEGVEADGLRRDNRINNPLRGPCR